MLPNKTTEEQFKFLQIPLRFTGTLSLTLIQFACVRSFRQQVSTSAYCFAGTALSATKFLPNFLEAVIYPMSSTIS